MIFDDYNVLNSDIEKNLALADLHLHTYFSDGTISPDKLISQIPGTDYRLVSITDHNSIDAYMEKYINLAKNLGVSLLPGVEMDCGNGLDILVYDREVGVLSPEFLEKFTIITRKENKKRLLAANKLFGELILWLNCEKKQPDWINWNRWGNKRKKEFVDFYNEKNLLRINLGTGKLDLNGRTYLSKPHIARLIYVSGLIDYKKLADEEDMAEDKIFSKIYRWLFKETFKWEYDSKKIDEKLIKEIKGFGFKMILAHPGKTIEDIIGRRTFGEEELKEFISNCVFNYQLDGAECLYRTYGETSFDYNLTVLRTLKEISRSENKVLFATAGSDRHSGF